MSRREIQINKKDFVVYGNAPFMVIPLAKTDKNPGGVIIIESANMALAIGHHQPLRFNILTRTAENGADIAVVFTGDAGKEQAEKVVWELNKKLR